MLLLNRLSAILLLLLCVRLSKNASLSKIEQEKYKSLIEGQGLYNSNDDVEVLTGNNFNSHVYGQKNAWIVEFYNSWCGFCQRFAPSWKALAADIKGWKGVVNVGALDCSADENTGLCRNFEIMAYPTLRYFHESYEEGPKNIGVEVTKGGDVEEHKVKLVQHIISEQQNKRGVQFPILQPYNHTDIHHLFVGLDLHTKYVFLIIDHPEGILGPELAMDFNPYKLIGVRYSTTNNINLIKNLNVKKIPYMTVLSDDNKSFVFPEGLVTRDLLRSAIINYVKPVIEIADYRRNEDVFTGKWIDTQVPDINSLMELKAQKALRNKVKQMGDVVFQADLETALRHSLINEVGLSNEITGDRLKALHDYLNVLVKYFPFGINGNIFLTELLNNVRQKSVVNGAEIVNIVKIYDDDSKKVFSSKNQWVACLGSTTERRGYPCGLWKLFHYLTVQAALVSSPPKEVLHAMYGYIRHFFGCADCSRHFQDMAHRKELEGVSSSNSAILWLWMAHNDVNKRLGGDTTEDPEYPKIQFPSTTSCPKCRNSDNFWNYNEVLIYLKNMYSKVNIKYIGSDSRLLDPGSLPNGSSTVFEQIDASMCFILYLLSFFLIVLLIRIFLKRGYRKKTYAHDLLGKV